MDLSALGNLAVPWVQAIPGIPGILENLEALSDLGCPATLESLAVQ